MAEKMPNAPGYRLEEGNDKAKRFTPATPTGKGKRKVSKGPLDVTPEDKSKRFNPM